MTWLTDSCPDPHSFGIDVESLRPLPTPAPAEAVAAKPVLNRTEPLESAEADFQIFRPYAGLGFDHCPKRLLLRVGVLARLASGRA